MNRMKVGFSGDQSSLNLSVEPLLLFPQQIILAGWVFHLNDN
jgi:hypothetical protein